MNRVRCFELMREAKEDLEYAKEHNDMEAVRAIEQEISAIQKEHNKYNRINGA